MTVTKLKQPTIKAVEPENKHPLLEIPVDHLLEWTRSNPADLRMIRINNNSMSPHYIIGDYVLVNTAWKTPREGCEFVIGNIEWGCIRRFQTMYGNSHPHKVLLHHFDKKHEPIEVDDRDIEISGRVIGKWERK